MVLCIGLALLCLTSTSYILAEPVNRTIDDEYGDSTGGGSVQYTLSGSFSWNHGAPCSGCSVQPNQSLVFDGTWHDITAGPDTVQATVNLIFCG